MTNQISNQQIEANEDSSLPKFNCKMHSVGAGQYIVTGETIEEDILINRDIFGAWETFEHCDDEIACWYAEDRSWERLQIYSTLEAAIASVSDLPQNRIMSTTRNEAGDYDIIDYHQSLDCTTIYNAKRNGKEWNLYTWNAEGEIVIKGDGRKFTHNGTFQTLKAAKEWIKLY